MYLVISLFTLFNAGILYISSGSRFIENKYLSVIFFLLSLRGFGYIPTIEDLNPLFSLVFFANLFPLNLLIGPFVYFYFRFYILEQKITFKKDYKHFIMCFLAVINMIPFYVSSMSYKRMMLIKTLAKVNEVFYMKFWFGTSAFYYLATPLFTLFYVALSFILLENHSSNLENKLMQDGFVTLKKWLYLLLTFFLLLFLSNLIMTYSVYLNDKELPQILFAIPLLGLFLLNMSLYRYPQILYGIKFTKFTPHKKLNVINKARKEIDLDQDFKLQFERQIIIYRENKDFTKNEFSLSYLSNDMNIPKYKLEVFFKNELQISFIDFRNEMRIQYFLDNINKEDLNKYNLGSIIKEYGFNKLSTFKLAFNKYHQTSLSEFLQSIK
jgi:AraC-like DNA-binding protein